jgi:hypothetical protein
MSTNLHMAILSWQSRHSAIARLLRHFRLRVPTRREDSRLHVDSFGFEKEEKEGFEGRASCRHIGHLPRRFVRKKILNGVKMRKGRWRGGERKFI